jgi:hypothetical protein
MGAKAGLNAVVKRKMVFPCLKSSLDSWVHSLQAKYCEFLEKSNINAYDISGRQINGFLWRKFCFRTAVIIYLVLRS